MPSYNCRDLIAATLVGIAMFAGLADAQTPPPPGPSDMVQPDVAQAEAYAAEAFEAYRSKEYSRAVALYRKAFDVLPAADILFNIARIYDIGLRDRPLATTFYRRYVADPGANPERIQLANDRLVELREAEETASMAQNLAATGPEGRTAPATLGETGMAGPAAEGLTTRRILALTAGGLGLVGLGIGTVFGLIATSDYGTAQEDCTGSRCTSQRGVDATHAAYEHGTISTIGLVSGGALLAGGVTLWFLGSTDSAQASDSLASGVRVSPAVDLAHAGARVVGVW